jgi:hypothetical protein
MKRLVAIIAAFAAGTLTGCSLLPFGPVWSSDGRSVAYSIYDPLHEQGGSFRLRIFDMETGAIHKPDISILQVARGGGSFFALDTEGRLFRFQPPLFSPEPVSSAPDACELIAPRPAGEGIYCLTPAHEGKSLLLYLNMTSAGNALSIAYEGNGLANPVVTANGKALYLTRLSGGAFEIVKFDVSPAGPLINEEVIFREEQAPAVVEQPQAPPQGSREPPAAVPSLDAKTLIVVFPGLKHAFLVDVERKSSRRIELIGEVLWAGFGPLPGNLRFVVHEANGARSVDVAAASGKTTAVGELLSRPHGHFALDPSGRVLAEISPGGLRIADLAGLWQRFYPETDEERLFAAASVLDKHPEEALLYADDRSPQDIDGFKWHLIRAQAFSKIDDTVQSARSALDALLLYPVTDVPLQYAVKTLAGLPLTIDKAAMEVAAALSAQPKEALALLVEVEPFIARSDLLAGIAFRKAHASFRLADFHAAARDFRKAAQTDLFPQRDYAAVLSMVSYYLEGRPDLSKEVSAYTEEHFPGSPVLYDAARLAPLLPVWAERPERRRLRLSDRVDVVSEERSDFSLILSLSAPDKIQVEWLPRVRLALEQTTETGKKERRELLEIKGFWAGYAARQDNMAFGIAFIDACDVEIIVVKLPGTKLAQRRFKDVLKAPATGAETLTLEFSPSASRLIARGAGLDLELELPETLPPP